MRVLSVIFNLFLLGCSSVHVKSGDGVFSMMPECDNYRAYSSGQRLPKYDLEIGLSPDSVLIGDSHYRKLYIWESSCNARENETKQSAYYVRLNRDRVDIIVAFHSPLALDTVRSQVLFDFNAKPDKTWTVKGFGFGNRMNISLKAKFLQTNSLDTVYQFEFFNTYSFERDFFPANTQLLNMIYVTKKDGPLRLDFSIGNLEVETFSRKGMKYKFEDSKIK